MNNTAVHFSSATVEWSTPQWIFDLLHQHFKFTLDPCSTHGNAKCPKHYTRTENGLARSWAGERIFMNPPYGKEIAAWVEKARLEALGGALVVGLLPSKTGPRWWHDHVLGHADVYFMPGRLKFGGAKASAPFDSALALWHQEPRVKEVNAWGFLALPKSGERKT